MTKNNSDIQQKIDNEFEKYNRSTGISTALAATEIRDLLTQKSTNGMALSERENQFLIQLKENAEKPDGLDDPLYIYVGIFIILIGFGCYFNQDFVAGLAKDTVLEEMVNSFLQELHYSHILVVALGLSIYQHFFQPFQIKNKEIDANLPKFKAPHQEASTTVQVKVEAPSSPITAIHFESEEPVELNTITTTQPQPKLIQRNPQQTKKYGLLELYEFLELPQFDSRLFCQTAAVDFSPSAMVASANESEYIEKNNLLDEMIESIEKQPSSIYLRQPNQQQSVELSFSNNKINVGELIFIQDLEVLHKITNMLNAELCDRFGKRIS